MTAAAIQDRGFLDERYPGTMSSHTTRRRRLSFALAIAAAFSIGTTGVAAPAAAVPPTPAPTTPPPAPERTDPEPAADEAAPVTEEGIGAAIDEAKANGRTVPIAELTTTASTTTANPDGTLTTTYAAAPQRVRQGDSWVPIDTTLVQREDGSLAPRATTTGVVFGGGGSGELVTLQEGAKSLRFTWPEKLPKPAVAGDTATYPEVMNGVDLKVTANASGYSSTFVIKSAAAAADPRLERIDLGLTGTGVDIAAARNGGAEAVDPRTKAIVFQANTALMWDSSPVATAKPAGAQRAATAAAEEPPSATHPGGRRAQVKVGISKGKQTLTLDKALLTAKTTTFPVYVDPDWQAWTGNPSQMKWARISSNGWDVYNSTSTATSNSPRFGLDDWPGGAGEKARTYYQMNTAGVKGAVVQSASLYLTPRWAASCYNTAVAVYGTGAISKWNASGLSWGKEPARGSLLDTANAKETGCGTDSAAVYPPSLHFDVTGYLKSKINSTSVNFLVEAKDMNDKYAWKQLKNSTKGSAKLSVKYSYRPKMDPDNGKQHVKPSIMDNGRVLTTTGTPTLSWRASNKFPNGVQRNLMLDYHVIDKTGKTVRYGYVPGQTKYNATGMDYTVTPKLNDGDYTWRVTAKNEDGLWASGWTPTMKFTVDTKAPKAPTIRSTQFPPNQTGGAYSDKGTFAFGNDKSNNVVGYLFSLDTDLASVVGANKGTPLTATTSIKAGTIYYAKADNNAGTGTVVVNGTAGVGITPGTAGPHRVFAKAIDQAGSTSPQTTYTFHAGTTTPLYAYGDEMITGWTAKNADGTSTVVPPATTTAKTGKLQIQATWSAHYFAHGNHAMLANGSGKIALGESATFSFNLPREGVWEMAANLTTAADYGIYSLVVDKGKPTESVFSTVFDAYSPQTTSRYINLGLIKDRDGAPRALAQGVHTLTVTMTGTNAASGGYQAGIDLLRLTPYTTCPINNVKGCLNNTAISTFTAGTTNTVSAADADGQGFSMNAADLKAAGWNPGAAVTVSGASVTLPATFGDGKNDNILANGQFVTIPASGTVNRGNALVFVGFGVNGQVSGHSGRITYAANSGCNVSSQQYTLDAVPDWAWPGAGNAVVTSTRRNRNDATQVGSIPLSMVAVSVPLVCPRSPVTSVTLPLVSPTVQGSVRALHIFGMGIRPGSASGTGDTAARWTGTWSAAQDMPAIESAGGVKASVAGQTLRLPARVSIGGDKVRVRLSNATGVAPVTFDAASVAPQEAGAGATGTPVPLTFGGSASVTLAAGTEAYSDPVDLAVADRTMLLVSLKVRGTVTSMSGHKDAKSVHFISSDAADHTADVAGTAFSRQVISGLPWLAGVDVSTPADDPAGALVLYGDQTVNADTASGDGRSQLSDFVADALSTDEDGTYPMRAGVLNQGSSSWANRAKLPEATSGTMPESALGAVDRQILNQSNARVVLISSGSSDLLSCTGTAEACSTAVRTKLIALSTQLQQYAADDAQDYSVSLPSRTRSLKVYVATLPPFAGTHTAAQENARKILNGYIVGGGAESALGGYADGAIDFAAAVSTDGTATTEGLRADLLFTEDSGSKYPNDLYYQALATQYVLDADSGDGISGAPAPAADPTAEPVARWQFQEGAGTTVADTSASGTGTPENPQLHPVTLSGTGWGTGRQVGAKAGTFNGTSSYGEADLAFDTGKSFAVSSWVRLTDETKDRTVLTREGGQNASLYLQYTASSKTWAASMPSGASGDTVKWYVARSETTAQAGRWTHLAVVYDAAEHNLVLYVDGRSDGQHEDVAPFNDPSTKTHIGRSSTTWFAGDIADVQVWRRTVDEDEWRRAVTAGVMLDWQFEDESQPGVVPDLSEHGADGTLRGGASLNYEGHPNPEDDGSGWDAEWGSVTFDGTTGAVTSGARLLTNQSFSVTGWARLTRDGTDQAVVAQDGAQASRFTLGWKAACKCWAFTTTNTDAAAPAVTVAQGPAAPAAVNTWTYLAGVYDARTKEVRLYVNGALAATTAAPAGWNATGDFAVGRSRSAGKETGWLAGDVDDVRAHQGVLTDAEIKDRMTQ